MPPVWGRAKGDDVFVEAEDDPEGDPEEVLLGVMVAR